MWGLRLVFIQAGWDPITKWLTSPWLVRSPGFLLRPQPFPLKNKVQTWSKEIINPGWSFSFSSLKTDQDITLTPCSCQSPSPAGFLVLFALPCWPETGYTNQPLPFWHADQQLICAVDKVSLPERLITINGQETTPEKTLKLNAEYINLCLFSINSKVHCFSLISYPSIGPWNCIIHHIVNMNLTRRTDFLFFYTSR